MKFKFSKNLDYQIEAIDAVVGVFEGGKGITSNSYFYLRHPSPSPIVANLMEVDPNRTLQNVRAIQVQNDVEPVEKLSSLDFSIEMETGTGKTYVYLRTIFELHWKYGLKKFIILVPSVAIREGVLKTIEQTKEHFRELYNTGIKYFAYDSKRLSQVREFVQSLDVQVMIMTIQSFNKKELNIMHQTPDRFNGEKPIDLVAGTRPVVIMDEPQNMESELSKDAIKELRPLFKLRYSATHREIHNLLYRLTPVDAYRKGLVKKIEVYGVEEQDPGAFVFRVNAIETKARQTPRARVVLECKNTDGTFVIKEVLLKAGDDLTRKSGNTKYVELLVNEIDARTRTVELSSGDRYHLEEKLGKNKEAIFRTQIRETIKAHFQKQESLGDGIKVLSLFFIDRVRNYTDENGLIRRIFTQEFEKWKKNSKRFRNVDAMTVHNGYFAKTHERGREVFLDTTGVTQADKDAYDLIMKDKERLLSFSEPTSFIFSHSALREGWDNPNVFQICTLNETRTQMRKRQEIGRGMRLAVDTNGDRIYDPYINVLTVVANESYREFISRLQSEYNEAGYAETPEPSDARKRVAVRFRKKSLSEDFQRLWEKIRKRTTYNVEVKTETLIQRAVEKINQLEPKTLAIRVDKVQVDFDQKGKVNTIYQQLAIGERLEKEVKITNVLDRIANEAGITKMTVWRILSSVANLNLLFQNAEEYIRSVIVIIKSTLNELVLNEGLRYIPTHNVWEMSIFENFDSYADRTIASEKSPYDRVVWESKGEKEFAENLEQSRLVKVYCKLPSHFVVDTPLGAYNPDWAIVFQTDQGDKLYFVRETKFVDELQNLRDSEKQKIVCGQKHFETIGVDFDVSTKEDLSDLSN